METQEEIYNENNPPLHEEDFINRMLSESDYDIEDIEFFVFESFENQKDFEFNMNKFIKWYNENK